SSSPRSRVSGCRPSRRTTSSSPTPTASSPTGARPGCTGSGSRPRTWSAPSRRSVRCCGRVGSTRPPGGSASARRPPISPPPTPPKMTTLTIDREPAGTPAVEVRRVESLDDYLTALEIDWEAFEVAEAEREERRAAARAAWPLIVADGRSSVYLAYLDQRPVGF